LGLSAATDRRQARLLVPLRCIFCGVKDSELWNRKHHTQLAGALNTEINEFVKDAELISASRKKELH
jgi:hypothetical protein